MLELSKQPFHMELLLSDMKKPVVLQVSLAVSILFSFQPPDKYKNNSFCMNTLA